MERSFAAEVKQLALGDGQVRRGEGMLAGLDQLLDELLPSEMGRARASAPAAGARMVMDAGRRMLEDENAIDALLAPAASG